MLESLNCSNNQLTNLQLSNPTNLQYLYVNSNVLGSLNLREINYENLQISATDNPYLSCVSVADIEYAETNWIEAFDSGVNFSLDCSIPNYDLQSDSLALVALYNATDGPNWTNNTNWLTGPLDTWYGVYIFDGRVVSLNLPGNDLNGALPFEIGNLTAIQQLNLGNNNLEGELPVSIGNLTEMTELDLIGCNFNGTIPDEICNLINLNFLSLTANNLTGNIPSDIGNLTNIWDLYLGNNQLTGVIPVSIANMTQLAGLELGGNQLSGSIPDMFDNFPELEQLELGANQFTGEFPQSIVSLNNLVVLVLGYNNLFGEIPISLCELSQLQSVDFSGNLFDSLNCNTIQCLLNSGIQFMDEEQIQQSGFSLINGCNETNECYTLNFSYGWNLGSVPLAPDSTSLLKNFQPLIDNQSLVKVQDENGLSLEDLGVFGGWTNYIGQLSPQEGYKVKLAFADSITMCGSPVEYPYGIYLSNSWNIIGFPQFQAVNASDIIQPLIDNGILIKVQDEEGNSIEDFGILGGWQNFIGNFQPGEGYKVKVSSPDTLWIYESYPKSTVALSEPLKLQHFNIAISGNGVDHMNFNLVNVNEELLVVGDEVAVYDGRTCVGAMVITEDHLRNQIVSIPVSAADDSGAPGFIEGKQYHLRVWKASQNSELEIETELISGQELFTKHESVILSLEKLALTSIGALDGNGITEVNCYPNPFEKELVIEINLPAESEVEVKVVNQMGQMIASIVSSEKLSSGIHRFYWNTKDGGSANVAPGIFYILTTVNNNNQHNNKVVLTR
jgi:Leucine-rich repeat (LRR) protein